MTAFCDPFPCASATAHMVERLLCDDNAACFIDPDFCVESIACDLFNQLAECLEDLVVCSR